MVEYQEARIYYNMPYWTVELKRWSNRVTKHEFMSKKKALAFMGS